MVLGARLLGKGAGENELTLCGDLVEPGGGDFSPVELKTKKEEFNYGNF